MCSSQPLQAELKKLKVKSCENSKVDELLALEIRKRMSSNVKLNWIVGKIERP